MTFVIRNQDSKVDTIQTNQPPRIHYRENCVCAPGVFELAQGDCLELMQSIPDASVDMILCDLPYQVTKNHWDTIIPFDKLWKQYIRIAKLNAVICLHADGMFMADLMKSQPKLWRYNLVWDKKLVSGFLNAKKMPLRRHEEICVFYRKPPVYNPQKVPGAITHSRGNLDKQVANHNYGKHHKTESDVSGMKYPTSILEFQKPHPSVAVHPTQKPVELAEWLIATYTNPGALVVDNCMGSGTTGVAAVRLGRKFIGIEQNEEYFEIATGRVTTTYAMKEGAI